MTVGPPLDDPLLALAIEAGRAGAALVRQRRPAGRVEIAATKSSDTDVVTEIDRACEDLIRDVLLGARPDDGFVGEEHASRVGTSGVDWVVDPIDGTVNFVYGIPAYAVAVAARTSDGVRAAYVVNIALGEEWAAVADRGAWRLDGAPRRVVAPRPPVVSHLLVATGFSYDADTRRDQGAAVAALLPRVRDVRRMGAAALDLCHVAEGRVDAYVEQGLQEWDRAAASLVAQEAGIVVTGLDGPADGRLVVAAHPDVLPDFQALLVDCRF